MSEAFLASPLAQAIGFALLQFLWQGVAIWAMTALLLLAMRRASPHLRHAVACLGLAAMVLAPVITAVGYFPTTALTPRFRSGQAASTGPAGVSNLPASHDSLPLTPIPDVTPIAFSREWLEPRLPFVMLIWTAGVLILTTHLFRGWWRVRRLHRTATPITEGSVIALMQRLGDRIGVTRRLQLVESALVEVPAVIGWLRPAIVVPASVLTGLPTAHLEAILAHELAHIRRADYLINLGQCAVEILLFYHPAVWWVSRQIRIEREHCCDDVAASLSNRLDYARALASLEELRQVPALAMGAGGGELLGRIRRLVDPGMPAAPRASGWLVMTLSLTVLCVGVAGAGQISRASTDPAVRSEPAVATPAAPLPVAASAVDSVAPQRDATTVPAPRPPAPARGQQVRDPIVRQAAPVSGGGITGTVVDPQGGVVPGVTVTIARADATDPQARVTTTDAKGQFAFMDFVAGTYELTVAIPAFRTEKMKVVLGPGNNVNGTVRLRLGSVSESITVAGEFRAASPAQPAVDAQSNPKTPEEAFDAAKMHYLRGQYAEAQAATERALEMLRRAAAMQQMAPQTPASQFELRPPSTVDGPVRVGGSVREPKKITDVKPIYPQIALTAGVQGIVIVEAVIARDGSVRDARVLRSIALLDQAALDAVREWRFTPTQLNGVPVEVVMTVTVNFSGR